MKETKGDKIGALSHVLSERAVLFLKSYILNDMEITTRIDNMKLCEIEDKLREYEDDNINEDGTEKPNNYPFFERNKKASEVLAELYGIWTDGDVDYDNLNKRLSLT